MLPRGAIKVKLSTQLSCLLPGPLPHSAVTVLPRSAVATLNHTYHRMGQRQTALGGALKLQECGTERLEGVWDWAAVLLPTILHLESSREVCFKSTQMDIHSTKYNPHTYRIHLTLHHSVVGQPVKRSSDGTIVSEGGCCLCEGGSLYDISGEVGWINGRFNEIMEKHDIRSTGQVSGGCDCIMFIHLQECHW